MEQTNLTNEQYKTLAEFAGLNAIIRNGFVYVWEGQAVYRPTHAIQIVNPPPVNGVKYTPDTDDAQAFELLDRLIHLNGMNTWEIFAAIYDDVIEGGLTLRLSICHAVLAIGE